MNANAGLRSPLSSAGRQSDLTNAAIIWTECLHGTAPIRDALASVAQSTGATGAILYRCNAGSRRPRIIASFHRDASRSIQPLQQPVGPDLIPVELQRAKPGSVWRLEDAAEEGSARLEGRKANLQGDVLPADIIAIPLETSGGVVDVLEFAMDRSAGPGMFAAIGELARSLSFAWSRRPKGRIARLLANAPSVDRPLRTSTVAPLSVGNPWHLTPTEMRICNLIREGQDPARLVSSIGVAESTLRTHLRSIYAKAGVTGQVGLLRLLLSDAPAREA